MVDALAGMMPGPGGRRIVVAGEMLELGPAAEDLHRSCGRYMAGREIDVLIGGARCWPGPWSKAPGEGRNDAVRPLTAEFVESPELAGEWLAGEVRPGDVVLLKASRGVHLERALELWQVAGGTGGPRSRVNFARRNRNRIALLVALRTCSIHYFRPFNIFRYLTFRTAFASLTALFTGLIVGPAVVAKLREFQIGQFIREEGPKAIRRKPARRPWAAS